MSIDNSLDGVNAKLATTVGYVERWEKAFTNIGNGASKIKSSISSMSGVSGTTKGVGGGTPNGGGANFGNQSNTQSTNIMSSSLAKVTTVAPGSGGGQSGGSGGGGGSQGSASGFGGGGGNPTSMMPSSLSKFGGPAASIALGAFNAAWGMTPGVRDATAYQAALFPTAFGMAGNYSNSRAGNRIFGAIGTGASSVTDAQAAAAMGSNSGLSFNLGNSLDNALGASGFAFKMSGMNNAAAMRGQVAMYKGTSGVSSKLGKIGIFTANMKTGMPKDMGEIVDELWARFYGSKTKKISMQQFDADLLMGYLGADLASMFGDQPELYDQIVQLMRLKAKAGGMAGIVAGTSGKKNSADTIARKYGMTEYNTPTVAAGMVNTARSKNTAASADAQMNGYVNASYGLEDMNNAMVKLNDILGPVADGFYNLKGLLDTFGSASEGSAVMGFVSGLVGALTPFAKGGAFATGGTSTSDSINARLSKGEYVINARAAQQIGRNNLDALNSTGQSFGSAYASPSAAFAKGGEVTVSGNPALLPGDPNLGSFDVAGIGRSIRVAKDAAPALLRFLQGWQSDPVLGGGRFDLRQGPLDSYNYRDARAANAVSDHAGYAVDIRYDILKADNKRHMSDTERDAVRRLIAASGGALGWGGDYNNLVDEMHVYIKNLAGGASNNSDTSSTTSAAPKVMVENESTAGGLTEAGGYLPGSITGNSYNAGSAASAMSGSGAFTGRAGIFGRKSTSKGGSKSGNGTTTGDSAAGDSQLLSWLRAAGFSGESLREAWAIAMRESSGHPTSHNTNAATKDDSYGLFQINMFGSNGPARRAKFKQYVKGFTSDRDLLDPLVNARAAYYMSARGTNWKSWDIDSSGYGGGVHAGAYQKWYKSYPGDPKNTGMSHGSGYVSKDGPANLHQGEIVMPAAQAQTFREVLGEVLSGRGKNNNGVNITLNIEKATDEEAERFAKKVKALLENDARMERLSSR